MEEVEWLECGSLGRMLWYASQRENSHRKLRLFACACVRQVWDLLEDEQSRQAVELAEALADGKLTWKRVSQKGVRDLAERAARGSAAAKAARKTLMRSARRAANEAASYVRQALYPRTLDRLNHWAASERAQCVLLREILGNLFRPVPLDRAWLTSAVVGIAQRIYDERAFAALPILADALEEAGCSNSELLAHCRADTEHLRGCWLLDLVLFP